MKKLERIKLYLKQTYIFLIIILLLIASNGFFIYQSFFNQELEKAEISCDCPDIPEEIPVEEPKKKLTVDLKGCVKKPGVYELEEGAIINDLIKKAGGLKTNGTTENINLSKKLKNEDMIVVLSKEELKKEKKERQETAKNTDEKTSLNPSVIPSNKTKVALNSATKEELMTINGIGEAKAISIIEYREKSPFTKIEDILNVSGIGEALFEKIKEFITI